MGHKVVPNDTPVKARARQELFALLNDPAFVLSENIDDANSFSKIVRKALDGGLSDDLIARLAGMPDPDEVRELALGCTIPDPGWQNEIVAALKGELGRYETAAGYD